MIILNTTVFDIPIVLRNKSLSSNVSQLYYNGFIPFCVYTTYFTLPDF